MKILTTFLLLLFFASQSSAQKIIEQYISQNDSLRIGPGKNDFLPWTYSKRQFKNRSWEK